MTEIKHHLTDQILIGYASGSLPEAFNLVVATHISVCDECRARLGAFEAIGGGLIEMSSELDGDNLPKVDLNATMERIRRTPADKAPRPQPQKGLFPKALREYVGGDLDAVKWRPVGMGVRQAILKTSPTASVRLLYIPAGKAVPDHGHNGMELTLVLQGAFKDELDRFGPGDIEVATEDLEHTPIAEEGMDCICLAATDAPLKFNAFLPRLAQRFLRI